MNEEYLEQEGDMPEGWENNIILRRDGRGRVIEVEVPDDEEVDDSAAND